MAMAYGQGGTTEQIRGTVEQANEKGLKVGGRWLNWSQYSKVTVRPVEGDEVELEVARGKFINDARILGGSLEPAGEDALYGDAPDAPHPPPAPGMDAFGGASARRGAAGRPVPPAGASAPGPRAPAPQAPSRWASRERAPDAGARRLALVAAAAQYAAGRPELAPEDVVAIAAQWEAWVAAADAGTGAGPDAPG